MAEDPEPRRSADPAPTAADGLADRRIALPDLSDPDVARVRALVEWRMLGDPLESAKIGRFTVLEHVAEGGMGVVYAAYDTQLDRKVAIKLLRKDRDDDLVRRRIVREAQAMARLSHPNVAHVYEVGEHDGRTFIAMEFVSGRTLAQWSAEDKRTWQEVLALYVQAGRGIAAAHASGLMHRDFKPDNALVGDDGRVRVVDFGLARAESGEPEMLAQTQQDEPLATPLTMTGALLGTLAYMSAEQLRGVAVDAKSDQFSFCVALHEALYGERPFAGESRAELLAAVTRGAVREPPRAHDVAGHLRPILLRGLAADPADRWPDMTALLAALEDDPSRRRRRRLALVGVAAIAPLGLGAWQLELARERRLCRDDAARIAEVWNDEAEAGLRAALLGTGVPYAADTVEHAVPLFDDYAGKWRDTYAKLCVATEVDGNRSAELWAASRACLDTGRTGLAAMLDVLTDAPDTLSVRAAVGSARTLEEPDVCADDASLLREAATGFDASTSADEHARLARVRALLLLGRRQEAAELGLVLAEDARAAGNEALTRAALIAAGAASHGAGSFEAAERSLAEAFDLAIAAGDDDDAHEAAWNLAYVVGYRLARHDEGLWWGRIALGLAERLGGAEGWRAADAYRALASVHMVRGAYEEAQRLDERALAIQEAMVGPDDPSLSAVLNNLANVHRERGALEEAQRLYERVIAIEESAHSQHPDVGEALLNLAIVHWQRGAYDEAQRVNERALALLEGTLGPDHAVVAAVLNNLANVHFSRGAYDEAQAMYVRALSIREKVLGTDHPDTATTLDNLAMVHAVRGDFEGAQPLFEQVLAARRRALGPDHPMLATSLANLAELHLERGSWEEGRTLNEQALAIWERALGPDHPELARALVGLARAELALGRNADARAHAERALALWSEQGIGPELRAGAELVLARALWAGGEHERAREVARAARDSLRTAGPGHAEGVREAEAWLAEH